GGRGRPGGPVLVVHLDAVCVRRLGALRAFRPPGAPRSGPAAPSDRCVPPADSAARVLGQAAGPDPGVRRRPRPGPAADARVPGETAAALRRVRPALVPGRPLVRADRPEPAVVPVGPPPPPSPPPP